MQSDSRRGNCADSHELSAGGRKDPQTDEKTGGSGFIFEKLDIFMGDDIFLPMQQLNHLRRQGLEALEEEMLRPWKQRKAKERDLKDIPETEKQTTKEFLTAAVETEEQLAAVEKTDGVKRIYADCGIFPGVWFCSECGKMDSQIGRRGERTVSYIAANSFETGNLMEGKRLFKNWFRKVLEAFWCGIWKAMES